MYGASSGCPDTGLGGAWANALYQAAPITWILSSVAMQSCDATCAGVGSTCDSKYLYIGQPRSLSFFQSVIANTYNQSTCATMSSICSYSNTVGAWIGPRAPFYNTESKTCYYNRGYSYIHSNECASDTYPDSYRFCPCVGRTTCTVTSWLPPLP